MADDGYMLSRSALRRIQAAVKWVESFRRSPDNVRRRRPWDGSGRERLFTTTSNWINAAGDDCYVPGNPTDDWDGTVVDTSTIENIYLPRQGSLEDPNVLSGKIIRATYDASGRLTMQGKYLDGTIAKSVKVWEGAHADLATDKPGWGIWSRLAGKWPVIWKTGDADYGTLTNTGGFAQHGVAENGHDNHNLAHTHCVTAGPNCVDTNLDGTYVARFDGRDSGQPNGLAVATHSNSDNRPPWGVLYLIVREANYATP